MGTKFPDVLLSRTQRPHTHVDMYGTKPLGVTETFTEVVFVG